MRTTKLNDHLLQLTRFGAINAYLVREDDGFTLVDTTLSGAADGLITAAAEAGGQVKDRSHSRPSRPRWFTRRS